MDGSVEHCYIEAIMLSQKCKICGNRHRLGTPCPEYVAEPTIDAPRGRGRPRRQNIESARGEAFWEGVAAPKPEPLEHMVASPRRPRRNVERAVPPAPRTDALLERSRFQSHRVEEILAESRKIPDPLPAVEPEVKRPRGRPRKPVVVATALEQSPQRKLPEPRRVSRERDPQPSQVGRPMKNQEPVSAPSKKPTAEQLEDLAESLRLFSDEMFWPLHQVYAMEAANRDKDTFRDSLRDWPSEPFKGNYSAYAAVNTFRRRHPSRYAKDGDC